MNSSFNTAAVDQQNPDFASLLERVAVDRDKKAFAEIFAYYAPRIKSFLLSSSIDEGSAEELSQETMVIVWRKAHQFDPSKARASTWIYTIARNKRIDLLRKNKRKSTINQDNMHALESVSDQQMDTVQEKQRQELVRQAMKALPEDQAQAIKLSFVEGFSHSEISDKTGLPLGTVKSRIRLGLRRLQNEFNDQKSVYLI